MAYNYVKIIEEQLVSGGDMSSNIVSTFFPINDAAINRSVFKYSIQATWTGGASLGGTLAIRVHNDGTWVTINGTSVTVSTNADSVMWNFEGHSYKSVHLLWTHSAGSGTLNVTINAQAYNI
jgi:hypothetical protein